jgi:hypothetical protein
MPLYVCHFVRAALCTSVHWCIYAACHRPIIAGLTACYGLRWSAAALTVTVRNLQQVDHK